ncbi:MAG: M20/M25/M40 family metallo-hydrolase, partial [Gemmatimonadota bacterium]
MTTSRSTLLAGLVALLFAPVRTVTAQPQVRELPVVQAALDALRADNTWTLTQQAEICEIPAPPFGEAARGEAVRQRFLALGLRQVRIDAEGNVIGERPGSGAGPRVALTAHLDTVFPDSTDVRVTRQGTRLIGPGIGDDCRGLAVILAVARALDRARVSTPGTIVFVATVGEEGPGNLRGVRHLFDQRSAGQLNGFISVDGTGLGLTSRAIGSHRYRVTFQGPGGHSFGEFGMPNPIHALGRAIAELSEIVVPLSPRTTFSVGMVQGGTSVNSIAMSSAMDIDFRSERQEILDQLDSRLRRIVRDAVAAEKARWPASQVGLEAVITDIGRRPASSQSDDAPIVQAALGAARRLGFTPSISASSTDANYPMSLGVPAVTI